MTMAMRIAAVALCLMTVATSNAQVKFEKYSNISDSLATYRALRDNTPIEPAFKKVPRFAIVAGDGNFVFSAGASVKFITTYDWGNPVTNPKSMGISAITKRGPGDKRLFQMSAGGSGIYFNIIGFPNAANEVGLFISLGVDNEANNTYKLNCGKVYLRWRGLLAGYAKSLYDDIDADPYTIDGYGPCASGAHDNVTISWTQPIGKYFSAGIGAELPKSSYTAPLPLDMDPEEAKKKVASSFQTVPDFPFFVQFNNKTGHVRLSAVWRNLHYVDYTLTNKRRSETGFGVKLSTKQTFGPVNLYGMVQYGKGIANYFKNNYGAGLDLVPADISEIFTEGVKLVPTRSFGLMAGAQYDINPKLFMTGMFSFLRNYTPEYILPSTTNWEDQMRRGYTVNVNAIYRISSIFSAGLEYRYGRRVNETYTSLSNNRVYAMLYMNF